MASRANRFRRLRQKRWFWPFVGAPAILLLVAMVVASPLVYRAFNAYRDVQVGPVEHIESAYVPVMNASGTPELVQRPTEQAPQSWSGDEPITILLLGVDKGQGEKKISRTDTIILVNIDPVNKTANMLSIPRDLRVVIPGYGVNKINAAFAIGEYNKDTIQGGGAGLIIRTIEENLGVPIFAFVQIDFQGFVKMVDTVGGVTLDVPYPILDDEYPAENYQYQRVYFPAGWQHLDGESALKYARTRHMDGDASRSARQQQVLLSLRDQAISANLIPQLPKLIQQFGDTVRTDLSIPDSLKLARLGSEIPRDKIVQSSLMPALYETIGDDGTYFLDADWDIAGEVLSEFSGTIIHPPGAALAERNCDLPILILNGTNNDGLAGRVGTILESNCFSNVQVDMTDDGGDHPQTTILDRDSNLGTSATITNLIGVGADHITLGDQDPAGDGTGSDSTDYGDYAIVVVLGDDTPDPADSQWGLDDYERETGDDTGGGEYIEPTYPPEDSGDGQ